MLNFNKTVTFINVSRHYNMKAFVKIILLCIIIFIFSLYITKRSIDNTFDKVHCSQTENFSSNTLIKKTVAV